MNNSMSALLLVVASVSFCSVVIGIALGMAHNSILNNQQLINQTLTNMTRGIN